MAKVPEQVRRAAERAEQMLNQANGVPANPEGETPTEPEAPQPESQPAAQPPQEPQPPASEQPAPAEQPVPADQPAATPTAEKPTDWEHKYKSLQGVLAAEQRAWKAEKAALETRLQALETAAKAPTQPEAPAEPKRRLTEKDVETYGPELIDLVKRTAADMADELVAQRLAELKPELEKTKQTVGQVSDQVYRTAQERFYGELAKEVPDWQQVNVDPRWLEWLGQVDPVFGVPRQAALDNASHKMDHVRTAALFKAFKEHAGLNKPAAPEPAPAAAAPAAPRLSPQPRTVGNAVATTPREPEVGVTRAEIDAHYKRASMDRAYRTSQEHKAMEDRIAVAMAAGRVS